MVEIISRDELKRMIDKNVDFVLIDVRDKHELGYGGIPKAKNLPLSEIQYGALDLDAERFEEIYDFKKPSKDDDVVFYCRTGQRSYEATRVALEKGFKARNYKGSIWEWAEIDSNVKRYGPAPD